MRSTEETFCVVVTYGNCHRNVRYSSGHTSEEEAGKLRDLAVRMGYMDVEVWREKDFDAYLASQSRGSASARRADRKSA